MKANDAIILSDENDKIIDVNDRACGMFGYSREEFLRLTIRDLKTEEWKEQGFSNRMGWEIETYGNGSFETTDLRKDGTEIIVEITNTVVIEAGKRYVFSIVRDHTLQKKAELELKRSEAIKQSIMESSYGINIWAVDTRYRYIFFNDAHRKGMKEVWNADIQLGECLLDYVRDPEYREQVRHNYDKMVQGESNNSTDRLQASDGSYHYYENTGYPVYGESGEIIGATIYTTDITERVKLEKELKQTLALLQSIMNSPPDVIIMSVDRDYRYIFFNNAHKEAMLRVWGVEPRLGDRVLDLLSDPEYRERVKQGYDKVLAGGYISSIDEFNDKNGRKLYYQNISAPIYNQEGEITGITLFILDVTEQTNAEEAIRESLHEKEILLKEVHHRVKNNLQIISSMLNMQIDMSKNKNVRFELREGQNRINTMALIHDQLYQSENLGKIDMQGYIRNLVSFVVDSYRSSETVVQVEFDLVPIFLKLDQAIPLGLIINELVSNSMKYAFEGRKSGRIQVGMGRTADSCLRFVVRDDGLGLPADFEGDSLNTLGIQLITALSAQINGEFQLDSDEGVEAVILFHGED